MNDNILLGIVDRQIEGRNIREGNKWCVWHIDNQWTRVSGILDVAAENGRLFVETLVNEVIVAWDRRE